MTESGERRESRSADAGRKVQEHVRGSGLLFAGRLIALLLNFAVQVLTVRYLTKSDYGAFAYALSIATVAASFNLLGLGKAATRFTPIHDERGEPASVMGTVALAVGSVVALGIAIVAVVLGVHGLVGGSLASDPLAGQLLVVLIALTPLQALDSLLQGLAAVFVGARAIFFRRYLLAPTLKLAAILLVTATGGSVYGLAAGYLGAGLVGVAVYALLLHRAFRERGLWRHLAAGARELPAKRMFAYGLPLLTADVVLVLKTNLGVLVLEATRGTADVASFRAVVPLAGLIAIVLQSFKILFVPLASRLFARGDGAGVGRLYWHSALWVTVLSFPVFCACLLFARPLAVLLFGERYAGSGTILAVLAVGYYFNAALGLNTYVLQVYGRVRYVALVNVAVIASSALLNVWLIGRFGALGAALATTGILVLHNVLNQVGLRSFTGVGGPPPECRRAYLQVTAATAVLAALHWLLGVPPIAVALLVALTGAVLFAVNRRALDLEGTFPELRRIPGVGPLLAGGRPG